MNGRFDVGDVSVAKSHRLLVEVRDLFVKFGVRFLQEAVWLHPFLVRAR